ncbi:MAG TPA: hypothetical protein VFD72_06045 [Sphingobacteriaceae bacterium]|nr:hypothetical protein [Sphingobacteriaceae bacterium]
MNKNYWICGFLLIVFSILHSSEVNGQSRWRGFWKATSAEYEDDNFFYVGIIFPQYSYLNYTLDVDPDFNTLLPIIDGTESQFNYIATQGGSSMGIGLPVRIRINDKFSLTTGVKFMASEILNFSAESSGKGPKVSYHYPSDGSNFAIKRLQRGDNRAGENFNTVEIPLHVRLYSNKNFFNQSSSLTYRLYLTGGTNYLTHVGSKKYYNNDAVHEAPEPPLIVKPSYWNLEGGLGFSLYTIYSKISFETKYSQSIGNILDLKKHQEIQGRHLTDNNNFPNPYMDALSKLGVRGWHFSIIFE